MFNTTKLITTALLTLSLASAAHAAGDNAGTAVDTDSQTITGTDRGGAPKGTDRGGKPGGMIAWLMHCIGNGDNNE